MDKDAQKDFTCRMTEDEYFRYKKNLWISLNTSGKNEPMKLRSDFSEASTKLHRLHRESGEEWLVPIPSWQWHPSSSSSSTSWWQWNDSWLSSWKFFFKKNQAYKTVRPVVQFLHKSCSEVTLCKIFFCCSQIVYSWQQSAATDGGVWTAHPTRHIFLSITHLFTRTRVAQVISLACAHHIPWVISMRSCYVFDSLRLLHFPLFAVHLLSYRLVFPSGHQLHLPRCGGQIPRALQLMRILALLPSTTLSHVVTFSFPLAWNTLLAAEENEREPWSARGGVESWLRGKVSSPNAMQFLRSGQALDQDCSNAVNME